MKKILTILALLLASVSLSWAQQKSPDFNHDANTQRALNARATKQLQPSVQDLKAKLEGTYRIEYSQANRQILYTRDLLETIQNTRQELEDQTIQWDPYTRIIVYAQKTLENNNTEH